MALFPPSPGPCAITSICPPSENLPAVNKPAARGARGPCAGAAQVGLGLALAARHQRSRHSGCQGVLRRELNLEILLKALNLDRETLTLTSGPAPRMGSVFGDMAKRQKGPGTVSLESLSAQLEGTEVLAKRPDGLDAFICTHHGTFHADEVMACAMLKCLENFQGLPILRTRDPAEIDQATIVVDVGGTYEPEKQRFDHHQKTFTETYSEAYSGIKLSSAGLVFKHFGAQVVQALCGPLEEKSQAAILAKTYDSLIRELDALDNGVQVADEPRYRFVTHLGARVGRLNPSWQEENNPAAENTRFKEALLLAAKELCDIVGGYSNHWLPARSIVDEALSQRKDVHPSGEIMKLKQFCPWQDHLFDLEEEEQAHRSPLVKYVIFQDSRGSWRVQAAPKVRGSFELRQKLPSAWCGVRDDELSKIAEIPGCIFVHANGFIGGNATEEGALAMATKAL